MSSVGTTVSPYSLFDFDFIVKVPMVVLPLISDLIDRETGVGIEKVHNVFSVNAGHC